MPMIYLNQRTMGDKSGARSMSLSHIKIGKPKKDSIAWNDVVGWGSWKIKKNWNSFDRARILSSDIGHAETSAAGLWLIFYWSMDRVRVRDFVTGAAAAVSFKVLRWWETAISPMIPPHIISPPFAYIELEYIWYETLELAVRYSLEIWPLSPDKPFSSCRV